MMILAHLFAAPVLRFSELQRAIPGVSQKMLIQQLRELERHDILRREVHPEVPPKVEYSLTDIGKALGPVFAALLDWAALRAKAAIPGRGQLGGSPDDLLKSYAEEPIGGFERSLA